MTRNCKIESLGVKIPQKCVTTSELTSNMVLTRPPKMELLTGIHSHRVCGDHEDSLTLAFEASLDCLRHSKFSSSEIEMIISCSISKYVNGLKHLYEPPLSLMLKEKLENRHAINFDVSNACAGMMTGVHLARIFISEGTVRNCLVVSGEYITSLGINALKNIDSSKHPEIASLTVGDAGAAVLLSETENGEGSISVSELVTLSQFSDLCTGYQSATHPGGIMNTQMKKIHEVSIRNAPAVIEKALEKAGLRMSQIDHLIPHQTAKHSIELGAEYFQRYFGESPSDVILNLAECGNTASTTHFTALYKCLCEKRIKKGQRVMLLSFASGLVIGVMIFTANEMVGLYGFNN